MELEERASNPKYDRVDYAISWLKDNHAAIDQDTRYHINAGYTYLGANQLDLAEVEFMAVLNSDTFRQQGKTGLGRTYYARGRKSEGVALLKEAVEMFVGPETSRNLDPDKAELAAELLCEVAKIYEELKQPEEAVDFYERSLKFNDNLDIWWKILKLLCEIEYSARALDLLSKWDSRNVETGGGGLAEAVFRSANDDPLCEQLALLVHAIRDEALRDRLRNALMEARLIADKDPQTQAGPGLLYLHGVAIARGKGPGRREEATAIWRQAVWSQSSEEGTEWGFQYNLYLAAKGVALYEFERFSATLLPLKSDLSKEVKMDEIQKLRDTLQGEVFANTKVLSEARTVVDRFVVSMCVLLDQTEEARQVLRTDMSNALEILRDDDPVNDLVGIEILLRVLCSVGDEEGTLTAFTLLDRQRRSHSAIVETRSGIGKTSEAPMQIIDSMVHQCDGCRRDVSSADPEGFWWCQFCADFDLCPNCHEKFVSRKLSLHLCNPDHVFIHLYHTEYKEEEVAHGMIRVDWDWEDLGDGKFIREGGRIITVTEWLGQLRTSWKIIELQTNLTAQD